MHRFAACLAAVLLAVCPGAAAASAEVAALQVALKARGLYRGPIDGIAGPRTAAGVRAAQARAGLVVDGIAGPLTRQSLGPLGRPPFGTRVLRAPALGWDVSVLQWLLAHHGFASGTFDGAMGARTASAVARFQAARGLIADAVAGPVTMAAVRRPPPQLPIAMRMPVSGPVTSPFGPRWDRFHTGVDIAAAPGAPVRAAASGCVRFAGDAGDGFGTVVSLGHSLSVTTLYAHLSATAVRTGACVSAGAVIGRVGSTGFSQGPHLHFEARVNGGAVDPLPALSAARA
jgi:murein DD-endopeptidase MepM/ murein hydrolase activator NlpD